MANTFNVEISIHKGRGDNVIYSGRVLHSRQEAEREADFLNAHNRANRAEGCDYHIVEFCDHIHCVSRTLYKPTTKAGSAVKSTY